MNGMKRALITENLLHTAQWSLLLEEHAIYQRHNQSHITTICQLYGSNYDPSRVLSISWLVLNLTPTLHDWCMNICWIPATEKRGVTSWSWHRQLMSREIHSIIYAVWVSISNGEYYSRLTYLASMQMKSANKVEHQKIQDTGFMYTTSTKGWIDYWHSTF